MNLLLDPFAYEFFPRALLASCLVLALGAVAGVSVRAQGQIYLGQGMSQSLLAGLAAAAIAGLAGFIASFLAALIAALLVSVVSRVARSGIDVAIAVVSSAFMSAGIAVLSLNRNQAVNVTNVLFGNVLGVTWADVAAVGAMVVFAGSFFLLFARKLALLSLDPSVAAAHGVQVRVLTVAQIVVVSLSVASFVQVAGTLLSVVALVLPTAIAQCFSRSLFGMHVLGVLAGVVAAVAGLMLSFWTDVPSGPAITLVATGMLVVSLVVSCTATRAAT